MRSVDLSALGFDTLQVRSLTPAFRKNVQPANGGRTHLKNKVHVVCIARCEVTYVGSLAHHVSFLPFKARMFTLSYAFILLQQHSSVIGTVLHLKIGGSHGAERRDCGLLECNAVRFGIKCSLWGICCLQLQGEDRDKFLRNVVAYRTALCHVSLDSNPCIPELSLSHRIVIIIHGHHLTAGVHRFFKTLEPPQNFKRQEGGMKQVPY